MGGVLRPTPPPNPFTEALRRLGLWARSPDVSPLAPLTRAIQGSEVFAPGGVNRPALNESHPAGYAPPTPGPAPLPDLRTMRPLAAADVTATPSPVRARAEATARAQLPEKLTRETQREGLKAFDAAIASAPDPTAAAALGQRKAQYLAQTHRQLELGQFWRSAANALTLGAVNRPIYQDLARLNETGTAVTPEELRQAGVTVGGKTAALEPDAGLTSPGSLGAMVGSLPYFMVGAPLELGAARAIGASEALGGTRLGAALRAYAAQEPTAATALGRIGQRALLEAPLGAPTGALIGGTQAAVEGQSPVEGALAGGVMGLPMQAGLGALSQGAGEAIWKAITSGTIRAHTGVRAAELLPGIIPGAPNPEWLRGMAERRAESARPASVLNDRGDMALVEAPTPGRGATGQPEAPIATVKAPGGAEVRLLTEDHAYGKPAGAQIKRAVGALWSDLKGRLAGGGSFEEAPPEAVTPFRRALGYDRDGGPTKVEASRYGQVVNELARRATKALGRAVTAGEVRGALMQDEGAQAALRRAAPVIGAGALAAAGMQSDDDRVKALAAVPLVGMIGGEGLRPGERVHPEPFGTAKEAGQFAREFGQREGAPPVRVRPTEGGYEVVVKGESQAPVKPVQPRVERGLEPRRADEQVQLREQARSVIRSVEGPRRAREWAILLDESDVPGLGTDAFRGVDPDQMMSGREAQQQLDRATFINRPRAGDNQLHSRLQHFIQNLPEQEGTGEEWLRLLKGGEAHNIGYEEVEATLERPLKQMAKQRLSTADVQRLYEREAERKGMRLGDTRDLRPEEYGEKSRDVSEQLDEERANASAEHFREHVEPHAEAGDTAANRFKDMVDVYTADDLEPRMGIVRAAGGLTPAEVREVRGAMHQLAHLPSRFGTPPRPHTYDQAVEQVRRGNLHGGSTAVLAADLLERHRAALEPIFNEAQAHAVREREGRIADPARDADRWERRRAELEAERQKAGPAFTGRNTSFAGYQRVDKNAPLIEHLARSGPHTGEVQGDALAVARTALDDFDDRMWRKYGSLDLAAHMTDAERQERERLRLAVQQREVSYPFRKGHYSGDQSMPGTLAWARTEDMPAGGRRVIEAQSHWGPVVRDEGGRREVDLTEGEKLDLENARKDAQAAYAEAQREVTKLARSAQRVEQTLAKRRDAKWNAAQRTLQDASSRMNRTVGAERGGLEVARDDAKELLDHWEQFIRENGPDDHSEMMVETARGRVQKYEQRLAGFDRMKNLRRLNREGGRWVAAENEVQRQRSERGGESHRKMNALFDQRRIALSDARERVSELGRRERLLAQQAQGIEHPDSEYPWMPWYRTERHIGLALALVVKRAIEDGRKFLYVVSAQNRKGTSSLGHAAADQIYDRIAPKWFNRLVETLGLPTTVERITDLRGGLGTRIELNDATVRILKRTGIPALGLLFAAMSGDEEDKKYARAFAFGALGIPEGERVVGKVLRGGFENGKAAGAFVKELAEAGLRAEVRRGEGGFDVIYKGEVKPETGTAVAVRDKMAVEPLQPGVPLERQRPLPGSPGRRLQPDPQGRFVSRLGQRLEALPADKGFTASEWLERLPKDAGFSKKEFDAVLRPMLEKVAAANPTTKLLPAKLLDLAEANQFTVKTVRLTDAFRGPDQTASPRTTPMGDDPIGYQAERLAYHDPANHPAWQDYVAELEREKESAEEGERDAQQEFYNALVEAGLSDRGARAVYDKMYEAINDERGSYEDAARQEFYDWHEPKTYRDLLDQYDEPALREARRRYGLGRGVTDEEVAVRLASRDEGFDLLPGTFVVKKKGDEWVVLDKPNGEELARREDRGLAVRDAVESYLEGEGEDEYRGWQDQQAEEGLEAISQHADAVQSAWETWREADLQHYHADEVVSDSEIREWLVNSGDLTDANAEPDPTEYGLVAEEHPHGEEGGSGEWLVAAPDMAEQANVPVEAERPAGHPVYDPDGRYIPPDEAARIFASWNGDLARERAGQLNMFHLPEGAQMIEAGPGETVARYEPTEAPSGKSKWGSWGGRAVRNYREVLTVMDHNPLDEQKYLGGHYYSSPANVHHMARMGERVVGATDFTTLEIPRTFAEETLGLQPGDRVLDLVEGQGDPANDIGESYQNKDPDKQHYTTDPLQVGQPVHGMRRKQEYGTRVITEDMHREAREALDDSEQRIAEIKEAFQAITSEHGMDPAVLSGMPEVQRLNAAYKQAMAQETQARHVLEQQVGSKSALYDNPQGITGTFIDSQQEVGAMNAKRLLQEAAEGGYKVALWTSGEIGVQRYDESYRGLYALVYDQTTRKNVQAQLQLLGYKPGEDFEIGQIPGEPQGGDDVQSKWYVKLPEGFDARVVKRGLALMGLSGLLLATQGEDGVAQMTKDATPESVGATLGTKLAIGAGVAGAIGGAWYLGRVIRPHRLERFRPKPGEEIGPTLRTLVRGRTGEGARARADKGPLPRLTDNAIERLGLTPDLAKEVAITVAKQQAARGRAPKVTWAETRAKAAHLLNTNPEALANLDPRRATGDEVLALASRASERVKQAAAITEQLKQPGLTPEARVELQEKMDEYDRDFVTFMSGAMKGASEQGRALNAAKILANVHADPEAWVYRAQRVLGPNQSLTLEQAIKVRDLANTADHEELLRYIAGLRRTSIPDQIVTVLNAGLFTRPAARVLDAIGGMGSLLGAHGPMAYPRAMLDYLIGKALLRGARSATAPGFWRSERVAYGMGEGWRETKRYLGVQAFKEGGIRGWVEHIRSADVSPEMLARYDIPRMTTIDMLSKARDPNTLPNKALDLVQKAIYRSLAVSDRVIVGAGYEGFLSDLALAQAKTEKAPNALARAKEIYANPSDELRAQALYLAHELTFQNEGAMSAVSRAVTQAPGRAARTLNTKLGMGAVGETGASMIDAAVRYQFPVVKTAANIAARVADYTPLGLVRGTYNIVQAVLADQAGNDLKRMHTQRKAVDALTRAGAGMALLSLGAYLAERGLMTGAAPTDSKEREAWRAQGKRPNSLLYKGQWRPVGRVAPGGTVLALGATLHELRKQGKTTTGGAVVSALGRTILDQPLLTGSRTALDALRDPVGMGENYTEGLASRAVPTAVGMGISAAQGSEYKDVHGAGQAIQARLDPEGKLGLWGRLPSQRTAFGDPVRGVEGVGQSLLNPFAGPTDTRQRDPLLAKLDDIGWRPRGTKRGDEETPLDFEQHMIQQGTMLRQELEATMASRDFQRADKIAARLWERNPTMVTQLADQFGNGVTPTSPEEVTVLVQRDMLTDAENAARAKAKDARLRSPLAPLPAGIQ